MPYNEIAGYGVRLTGGPDPVYIQAYDIDTDVELSGAIFFPDFRGTPVASVGEQHTHVADVSGYFIARNADGTPGTAVNARTFAQRFKDLVKNQKSYTIGFQSYLFNATSVVFWEGYRLRARLSRTDQPLYEVEFTCVEVS